VDDETIAYDLIKEMGPGGNFITAKHTRHFMRREHYQTTLSDKNNRDEWENEGSKTTWEHASEKVREILNSDTDGLPDVARQQILSEIKGIVE